MRVSVVVFPLFHPFLPNRSKVGLRDELSFRKAALEKGLREGRAEGREEGIKQEKLNTAKKLLQKGMTLSEAAEITGLSSEEIEGLR